MYWLHNEEGERVAERKISDHLINELASRERGWIKIRLRPPPTVTPFDPSPPNLNDMTYPEFVIEDNNGRLILRGHEEYLKFIKAGYA